jgi:hypothetical protein
MTELPIFRLAVKPTRITASEPDLFGPDAACNTRPGLTAFRRAAATRRKSARVLSRLTRPGSTDLRAGRGQPRRAAISRRQALAALCATRRQNSSAADSGHPRPKSVATLANEVAGLVSAFHGTGSDSDISLEEGRLYMRAARGSQRQAGWMRADARSVLDAPGLSLPWGVPCRGRLQQGGDVDVG